MSQDILESHDKFYVYRSLHSDESWGAILLDSPITKMPNIAFGMKVYAANEKEAITKAKQTYERMHMYDSDKRNIREFASGALACMKDKKLHDAARIAMEIAVQTNKLYTQYFNRLEENNE